MEILAYYVGKSRNKYKILPILFHYWVRILFYPFTKVILRASNIMKKSFIVT